MWVSYIIQRILLILIGMLSFITVIYDIVISKNLNRKAIGIELDNGYFEKAKIRLKV